MKNAAQEIREKIYLEGTPPQKKKSSSFGVRQKARVAQEQRTYFRNLGNLHCDYSDAKFTVADSCMTSYPADQRT